MLEWVGLSILLLRTIAGTDTENCSTACLEDPNNTTVPCNVTSGECMYGCAEGYVGPNCSRKCPVNCAIPLQNETELCEYESGYCTFGCTPGYVGSTCSCSEHCVNQTCNTANTTCLSGCTEGYAGPTCVCPSNCGSGPDPDIDKCNITSGECLFGCRKGYTGLNCSTACPENCALPSKNNTETCDGNSNECFHGCNQGFAGKTCSYSCPKTCRLPTGNKTDTTCNATTGECFYGCHYGYAGSNCSFQCSNRCGVSDELYSQTCDETSEKCLHGCIQGYGGFSCSFNCSVNCIQPLTNDTETCNESTERCYFGCVPGYAGLNCSFECPSNCWLSHENTLDTCNDTSGHCLHGCKQGLAGPRCSFICPTNCLLPEKNGSESCNYTTGECLHGCQSGYAGPNCSVKCPQNCDVSKLVGAEICNATTEECTFGCKLGYAGPNCSVECPQTCSASNMSVIEICNATSLECFFGCKDGSYGAQCENFCTDFDTHCNRCSITNGGSPVCNECIHNFYRGVMLCLSCDYGCAQNFSSPSSAVCRESDGYCNFGCITGRRGYRCETGCGDCESACHRYTGKCDACKYHNYCGPTCLLKCNEGCASQQCEQSCACVGRCTPKTWGEQCEKLCNENCVELSDATINSCDRSNGSCLHGCVNNIYWGSQCENTCSPACVGHVCDQASGNCTNGCNSTKVYGIGCDKICNRNCVNRTCERADGYCDSGCVKGSHGDRCHLNCSENCHDRSCNRTNGYCNFGCSDGFHGNLCDKTCSSGCLKGQCDPTSGSCTCKDGFEGERCEEVSVVSPLKFDSDWIYVAIACAVVVLLGVMTTIVLVMKKRRTIARRRRAERLSKIPDEKILEEAQMRHKRKGEGASARMTALFTDSPLARFMKYRSQGGGLITKIPLGDLLKKVLKMDENDYGREFDEFDIGLKKSHEVSRRTDNLLRNFFNGIYPYDENRVVLTHCLKDVPRKTKSRHWGLSVHFDTFRPTRNDPYERMVADSGQKRLSAVKQRSGQNDRSNGYVSVDFDIKDETAVVTEKQDMPISDDYATVEVGRNNQAFSSSNNETVVPAEKQDMPISDDYATVEVGRNNQTFSSSNDERVVAAEKQDIPISDDYATVEVGRDNQAFSSSNDDVDTASSDYAKINIGEKIESPAGGKDDISTDKAQASKENKYDTELDDDQSCAYAHVNKDARGKEASAQSTKNVQEVGDDSYAVVKKRSQPNEMEDTDAENKRHIDNGGTVVFQRDYINASFIKGYNQHEKYIAAQAPAKLTADDFWLMVWEQKSQFIVMLTVIPEDGYSRCEKYWPDQGEQQIFGDITVECEEVTVYANYTIRTLKLMLKNGIERDVIHMQFTSWPDEGCPVSAIEFIQFHQKYRSMTKGRHSGGPTIVHCTAGIGRTGVFIALDFLVEEGLDSLNVDVFKCVTALREQRVDMVHTMEQYEFLYKALAQTFALGCQPIHKVKLADKLVELKKFDHNSGKTKLEVLYDSLKDSLALDTAAIAPIDAVQERKKKDRPKSDVPEVLFRADLPHNAYINAVIFESSKKREAMVATQMPTPDTVQDFCQLLIYHKCTTVIMLNHMDPNDKTIAMYWPTEKTPFVSGQTIISQLHLEKQPDYNIRQLRVQSPELSGENGDTLVVTMVQYKGWKIVKNVPNAKNLLKLLQLCQRYIKDAPDKTLLVHCMNGAEQSGLFCALMNLLEVVDLENEISVTSVVRKILARRPNAIPTVDQFEACFTTTCEYIKKQENT